MKSLLRIFTPSLIFVAIIGSPILIVALLGFANILPFAAWGSNRYELVVDFTLDGRRYTGSTVWKIDASWGQPLIAGNSDGMSVQIEGEAIDIPLADGRTLFLLRRATNFVPYSGYGADFIYCVPGETLVEKVRTLSSYGGSCALRLAPWIAVADKSGKLENVTYEPRETNGRVVIHSTTASATDGPVTAGITTRHPWISALPEIGFAGSAREIYRSDFSNL